jgi:hypothetical protein
MPNDANNKVGSGEDNLGDEPPRPTVRDIQRAAERETEQERREREAKAARKAAHKK